MEHSLPSISDITSDRVNHVNGDDLNDADAKAFLRPLLESAQGQDSVLILTHSDPRDGNWSPYWRDLHIMSLSFLLVFLAYCAVQNLESSLNDDQGLGSAALGVLYLSLTVSSLGASMVVIWLGSKKSLLLGLSGYWAFITANLFPSWYTLIPAAVFLGFTASVLWVAEGTYLTSIARRHAAACNIPEATALGKFNAEFWSVFQLNQVVGNLLVLALLRPGKDADSSAESFFGIAKIFVVFLGTLAAGTTLMCFLRPHSGAKNLHSMTDDAATPLLPQRGLARASFALLCEKKMLLLTILFLYTGMQQAFIWGDFTKDIVTSSLGLSWVGGIMAAYGLADACGSFLSGRNSSGLLSMSTILCGGAFGQIIVLVWLFYKDTYSNELVDFVIIFTTAVLWGLGDAAFHTQISAALGIFYPHDIEAAFARWKILQSAGTSAAFLASSYMNFTTKLVVLFCSLLVSTVFFLVAVLGSATTL